MATTSSRFAQTPLMTMSLPVYPTGSPVSRGLDGEPSMRMGGVGETLSLPSVCLPGLLASEQARAAQVRGRLLRVHADGRARTRAHAGIETRARAQLERSPNLDLLKASPTQIWPRNLVCAAEPPGRAAQGSQRAAGQPFTSALERRRCRRHDGCCCARRFALAAKRSADPSARVVHPRAVQAVQVQVD